MFTHLQPTIRRRTLAAAAGSGLAAMVVAVAPSYATGQDVRELLKSTGHEHTRFAPLVAGTTYRASLVTPTPRLTPRVPGWTGAQFVTLQHGREDRKKIGSVQFPDLARIAF